MSYLVLKNLALSNRNLNSSMLAKLGWTAILDGADWKISFSEFDRMPLLLTNLEHVPVAKTDEGKRRILGVVKTKENVDLEMQLRSHSGERLPLIQITEGGLNSWLNAVKGEFLINDLAQIEDRFNEMVDTLHEKFNVRDAIAFSINIEEIQTILTIIKMSYMLQSSSSVDDVKQSVEKNTFWGILPSSKDCASYFHPFLVFSPYLMGMPIDRYSSGTIWIPEKTILPHYSSHVGLGEVLINNPSISIESGVFQLLGDGNRISRLRARKYAMFLLGRINIFMQYLLNPRTSCAISGDLKYDYLLQRVCTTQLIFSDFALMAASIDPVSRLNYFLSLIDKLANFRVQYCESILEERISNRSIAEKEAFDEILSREWIEQALSIASHHLQGVDEELCRNFKSSVEAELESLVNFSPDHDMQEAMRILRNLRHGAFLGRDQFFKLFGEGQVKLPTGFVSLGYLFMLVFVCDTKRFLEG